MVPAFANLIGIGEMELSAMGEARGAEGKLPAANDCPSNGEREEDVGSANDVVIEEIRPRWYGSCRRRGPIRAKEW